ncbi:MAG: hypothetical protein A4E62_01430 [Syntrophorhabdus sp. PtaU1.Bin002]|nr:MAG: hypothetical protein A4E62_01430 [Syntrophorhabdus sp. PtaU1.Bin002]
MDMIMQERFMKLWAQYFGKTELPIVFWYTDDPGGVEKIRPPRAEHKCVIAELAKARKGTSIALNVTAIGCFGGKRYLGFTEEFRPNIEYFLSYGIPGEMEGERYKKSPEIVREAMKVAPHFTAPGRFIVFKRWDRIEKPDNPDVVIFFARPDVLSGLFTLANYDQVDPNGVFSPFAAGCATIVTYPYLEKDAKGPRAVLGMFDVSARPCVQEDCLTFAVPMNRFEKMVQNMDESFLTTGSWKKIKRRIMAAAKRTAGNKGI